MAELFASTVFEHLRMLARPFVWRRKVLHSKVKEELHAAEVGHAKLLGEQRQTLDQLNTLLQEHALLSGRHDKITAELTQLRQSHVHLERTLEDTSASHKDARADWERNRQDLGAMVARLKSELVESAATIDALQQRVDEQLGAHEELRQQFASLQERHGDTWTRFQLISRLLTAQPSLNMGRARFSQLVAAYQAHIAQSASWSTAESILIADLEALDKELGLMLEFPALSTRTIVGVIGGFSSGKSEFINSFILDREIRLAIGVKPVTAIPSYVTADDTSVIRGFTVAGGHIDLDVNDFKRMSHAFLKSFDFDLKQLMPFMCLATPMSQTYFNQLCLLDTPGYNPPATASTYSQHDRRTAVQAAQQADALLWIIGLDTNGTVPASDLDFIREIGVERRAVHVVLNKADLKPDDALQAIMDDARAIFEQEDIQVEGISAYSSTKRTVLLHDGQSLFDFLTHYCQSAPSRGHIEKRLQTIFDTYEDTLRRQIDAIQSQQRCVNKLQLDALEFGGEEAFHQIQQRLNQLDVMLNTTSLNKAVHDARALADDLRDALLHARREAM